LALNLSSSDATLVFHQSCYFKSCVFFAIPAFPSLVLEISKVVSTKILQQQLNNRYMAIPTTKQNGNLSIGVLRVDINVWVCQSSLAISTWPRQREEKSIGNRLSN